MENTSYFSIPVETSELEKANGPVAVRLCNDYLFRAVMQEDNAALVALLRAIVRLPEGVDITSAEITNPVVLGKAIDEKEYRMDIRADLNNYYLVDMEMQVSNEDDWPERSLSYLCRMFDHAKRGDMYTDIRHAIQISLLNYTLFKDHPKLYGAYRMLDMDGGQEYSDKFQLYVVCLNETGRATEEDKSRGIDLWARFFRARTWEELKMTIKGNPAMEHAAATAYRLSAEEEIREQCEARERRIRFEETKRVERERLQKKYADACEELKRKNQMIEQITVDKDQTIADKDRTIADKDQMIEQITADKDQMIANKNQTIADKDQTIADKDRIIEQITAEIARLRKQLGPES